MKNWTIGKRTSAGFAIINLIAIALGVFAYTRLSTIRVHSDELAKKSFPSLQVAHTARKFALLDGKAMYMLIGSEDPADIAKSEEGINTRTAQNEANYAELDKLVTSEKELEMIDKVKAARVEYRKARADVIQKRHQSTNTQEIYKVARAEYEPASVRYVSALETLSDAIQADADGTSISIQSSVKTSQAGILVGLALAVVAGIIVGLLITRGTNRVLISLARTLDEGAEQVASASGEVSSASQTLAQGSSEQAASLEETSSSLEEMASMTKRNAENAAKANDLAKEARSAAEKGSHDMASMSGAMEAIKASSDDIAKIIKTIDEIAFQTNILALNAAVEAARAGEAGMGFAVVADEVRNLAQRSAQAAKETAGKIEGAISKTAQGVEISAKVVINLAEIVAKVRQVDELVSEVAGFSKEQTQGISQINTAVSQMDKITQSNAANAEESAAAAEELNAQSHCLKQAVVELRTLVGANSESKVEAPPVKAPRPSPVRQKSNGHSALPMPEPRNGNIVRPQLASARSNRSTPDEVPAPDDFKDF